MMKINLLPLLAITALFVAGCATHSHEHAMACSKCDCKMMQPDEANAQQCKMCHHSAAEHNQPAADATDHSGHH